MCGCGCACGRKNWFAGACAAHYQNVCNVRAGAAENPRKLTPKFWRHCAISALEISENHFATFDEACVNCKTHIRH